MYKEIVLDYEGKLNDQDMLAIRLFNQSFKKNEIQLDHDDARVIVLLREVDLKKLKELSSRLAGYTEKPIFSNLVESINRIKSYGIKGMKRNYVDYNKERKVVNRKAKVTQRGQYFYAQNHSFTKEVNELPEVFVNKILVGDSAEILKDLPNNSIDLVFTSPPYNFGLDYAEQRDDHFWEAYFAKLFQIFRECIRVAKYGGRIIVNIQPLFSDYIPSHHLISNFFINEKMIWKGEVLWEKNNYNCKYTAWGSWKSPSNPYLKYTWEFVEIFCKGALKKDGRRENVDISADEFKKWVVAKWSMAPERKMNGYQHPAMFPEELAERIIKLFSFQNDIVLDPFNGAGTTTLMAHKLNRRYLGIDISGDYCATAEKRINDSKKNAPLF